MKTPEPDPRELLGERLCHRLERHLSPPLMQDLLRRVALVVQTQREAHALVAAQLIDAMAQETPR